MEEQIRKKLLNSLSDLEKRYQVEMKKHNFSKEAKRIRILQEMIKEQVNHENTNNTTR